MGPSRRGEKLQRLASALRGMVYHFEESMMRAAREGKIHPTDFHCISFLANEHEPVSSKKIVAHLGLTSGSGTALFDRLEKLGYIHRVPNASDRRSVMIALDRDAAREPLRRLDQMRVAYEKVTERLSDAELDSIASYMENVSSISSSSPDLTGFKDAG